MKTPPPCRNIFRRGWRAALLPILLATATTLHAATPSKIAAVLQPYVDNKTMAGAVTLVADKDKILDTAAVGWMDIAAKKPMRTDCVFWIASQSKPVTATALMILVDESKVSVEDPVGKYLPEFSDVWVAAEKDADHMLLKRPSRPILVRDILSHTSGLEKHSGIEKPSLDLYPLEVRVNSYPLTPLLFDPGTKYSYSNEGINTAGRIVELVSGMPFEKFLDQRIFQPLGMKETSFWPDKKLLQRLAKAYKPGKDGLEECTIDQLHYPLDDPMRQPMPAGGLFSTAQDLSIFYRMIANNGTWQGRRILSEDAIRTMTSKQTGDLPNAYGFGFTVGPKFIGHGGAYKSMSAYDPAAGLIMIFLGQHQSWPGGGEKIIPAFQKAAVDLFAAHPTSGNATDSTVEGMGIPPGK